MFEGMALLLQGVGLFVVSAILIKCWEMFSESGKSINRVDCLYSTLTVFGILCLFHLFSNLYADSNLRSKLFDAQQQTSVAQQQLSVEVEARKVAESQTVKNALGDIAVMRGATNTLNRTIAVLRQVKLIDPEVFRSAVIASGISLDSLTTTTPTSAPAK